MSKTKKRLSKFDPDPRWVGRAKKKPTKIESMRSRINYLEKQVTELQQENRKFSDIVYAVRRLVEVGCKY